MNSTDSERFSWRRRARSFRFAFRGISLLFATEHNARIHLAAALLAIALGICLDISAIQWCLVIFCIAAVLSAEAFNSAVEALANRVSPEFHPLVRKAKDIAAAAVLFMAIAAFVIGLVIFVPPLLSIFFS